MKNFLFLAILAWVSVLFHGQQAYAATGVDFSALTSTSSLSCVKNYGYDHAVIRCYIEAWGQNPGGKVDSNCYQNYLNAKAAGFTSIDIYWFPCTGRSTCKSPATQLNEIVSYVGANKMIVGRLWLDVEIDPSANNWPSTTSARTTLQQFKTALDNSGWKWGVYFSCLKSMGNDYGVIPILILHDIRAYAYSMVGQFDSAFQDTTHMMTYGEKYALGYQRIGNLYSMGGRYQDAINIYDQGLRAISMTTKKDKEDEEKEQQQQQKGKEEEKKVLIQAKEQLTEIIMKKHQSTDFMTALPAEIVYLIITHLSESAKMTCLQVSRLWRQRTLECIAVWKSITMKVGSLPEYSQLLEVVPVIGQHVELLQINFPMSIPYIDALNSLKEGHFNRLKSLTMSASADCHLDAHMDLISDALWQVKDTLTNIRFIDHGNNSKTLLLANLLLASSKITDLGYKTNGYLSDVLGDTSMLIGNISNKFTTTNLSLVNLELTAASIQQQEIASLLPHLPHLRRLVLFGCKSLNFKFIEQTLPQLQIFAHDARSRIPELKELKPISTLINVNNDENNTNNGTVSTTTEENGDGVIVPTTTTTTSGLRILYANDGNAPGLSAHKLFLIVHKHMSTIETIYAKFAPIYRGEQEALFVLYPNLRFDNIKRLSFWAYDGIDDWIMGGIRYTTTLHYLSLANVENLGKVVDVLMKLPTLETLRLSYVRTTQYSASLAQLFEKYAQNYSHSDTTHNEKGNTCTASSRSLKRISLRFCDEVTDQVLLALSNIPTLESLVIQSLSRVSTHAINTLLAKVSHHLTIFDASSMDKVGDDTMNVLGDMTKLTDIYLNSLNNVSDEGIRSLMHRMNHPVSTISIRSCPSVSTEMIRVAKYKLKNPRSSSSG